MGFFASMRKRCAAGTFAEDSRRTNVWSCFVLVSSSLVALPQLSAHVFNFHYVRLLGPCPFQREQTSGQPRFEALLHSVMNYHFRLVAWHLNEIVESFISSDMGAV